MSHARRATRAQTSTDLARTSRSRQALPASIRLEVGERRLEDLAGRARALHDAADAEALAHLVRPSAPIVFFGDSESYLHSDVRVLTAGLNPSCEEFPSTTPRTASVARKVAEG